MEVHVHIMTHYFHKVNIYTTFIHNFACEQESKKL